MYPEKELRCLSPNFHIHVSVSDLYNTTFGHLFSCSRRGRPNRGIQYINRSQKHECRNWTVAAQFLCWEYLFRIFGIVFLQYAVYTSFLTLHIKLYSQYTPNPGIPTPSSLNQLITPAQIMMIWVSISNE
jgi:hypothetical protein